MSKVYGLATNKLATFFQIPLRITLLTASCMQCVCVCVLTCFSAVCNYAQATQTHSSLMLILFHFPASVAFYCHPNKERECTWKKTCWIEVERTGALGRYDYSSSKGHSIADTAISAQFPHFSELRIRNSRAFTGYSWSNLLLGVEHLFAQPWSKIQKEWTI